jgi:hypothetical protein
MYNNYNVFVIYKKNIYIIEAITIIYVNIVDKCIITIVSFLKLFKSGLFIGFCPKKYFLDNYIFKVKNHFCRKFLTNQNLNKNISFKLLKGCEITYIS